LRGRDKTSKFPNNALAQNSLSFSQCIYALAIKLKFDLEFPSLSSNCSIRASASTYNNDLNMTRQQNISPLPLPPPLPSILEFSKNSPLGYTHQKLPLRTLDKTRNAEPARLLLLAFAIVCADDIAHERAVSADGDFFGGGAEAADDGHARELRGASGGEGAGCDARCSEAGGGAEEEGHF
jgi:hypothetical protein